MRLGFEQLLTRFILPVVVVLLGVVVPVGIVRAQTIPDSVCRGVLSTQTGTTSPGATVESCKVDEDASLGGLAKKIINIFSVVVGTVSVIMIIIGGFRYIISGGDSAGVSGAKNTILYAIVGLIIVLFAQVIIRFILTNVSPSAVK